MRCANPQCCVSLRRVNQPPIPALIARPLIEGLRNGNAVHDRSAQRLFPSIQPAGYRVTVDRAIARFEASNTVALKTKRS